MNHHENGKFFDLHTTGIGYLNRIRQVTPKEGTPFTSVTIAALRGSAEKVQYTHFECVVSGQQAQNIVRQLETAVADQSRVLVGFKVSDLAPESFTFKNGERAGETGISLKARLIKIGWAKVDGVPVSIETARVA